MNQTNEEDASPQLEAMIDTTELASLPQPDELPKTSELQRSLPCDVCGDLRLDVLRETKRCDLKELVQKIAAGCSSCQLLHAVLPLSRDDYIPNSLLVPSRRYGTWLARSVTLFLSGRGSLSIAPFTKTHSLSIHVFAVPGSVPIFHKLNTRC